MTADEPAHADPETLLARLRRLDAEATQPVWIHAIKTDGSAMLMGVRDNEIFKIADVDEHRDAELASVVRNALPRLLAVVEAADALHYAYTMNASNCAEAADKYAGLRAELGKPG